MTSRFAYYVVVLILIIVGRIYLNISASAHLERQNISEKPAHNMQNDRKQKIQTPSDQNHFNQEKLSNSNVRNDNNSKLNLVASTNFSKNTSEQKNVSNPQLKEEYKNSVSRWMQSVEESFKYVQSENTTTQSTEDGSLVYLGSNRDHFQINSQMTPDGRIYADEVKTPSGQSFARIYDDSGRVKTYFYQSNEMNSIAVNYNENGEVESVKQYINGKLFEKKLTEQIP